MAKHGKKYRSAAEKIDSAQLYTPRKAVTLVKEVATANFDETIEAHFRLGVDTRKADQNIRGSISLPHGTGKSVRVAVFAEGAKADEAREAGHRWLRRADRRDSEGQHRVRRCHRSADHDGQGWPHR